MAFASEIKTVIEFSVIFEEEEPATLEDKLKRRRVNSTPYK
jgi:hypothetical protein